MWFDSSSIANLAKNALKEGENFHDFIFQLRGEKINVIFYFFLIAAQKHIDNVLDIKDEDGLESSYEDAKIPKSKTLPSIQQEAKKDDSVSVWGSFNGSFFENKLSQSAIITNPPPRKSETSSGKLYFTKN